MDSTFAKTSFLSSLNGMHSKTIGWYLFASSAGLFSLRMAITIALHQILGSCKQCRQTEKKSLNQFRFCVLAWKKNFGGMLSGSCTFPHFRPLTSTTILSPLKSVDRYPSAPEAAKKNHTFHHSLCLLFPWPTPSYRPLTRNWCVMVFTLILVSSECKHYQQSHNDFLSMGDMRVWNNPYCKSEWSWLKPFLLSTVFSFARPGVSIGWFLFCLLPDPYTIQWIYYTVVDTVHSRWGGHICKILRGLHILPYPPGWTIMCHKQYLGPCLMGLATSGCPLGIVWWNFQVCFP